ncbi:MAG TPA: ABC transporter permease [Thermoplasmata archaeon]|nr:ABC transporter permease [Thermoplasmata archaeon]HUJ78429.1 ABC transporter permease [Thermoplasmata archaeon]
MYREVVSLMRREYLRWIRAPTWVISGLMSPILYLVLFGQAFDLGKLIPANVPGNPLGVVLLGAPNYFSYFAIGMVAFASVTAAMFSGTGVIFDKQLGIQQRIVSTPASRGAIFSASLLFRGVLTLIPAFLVIGIALLLAYVPGLAGLSVPAGVSAAGVAEVLVAILTLSLTFTALFLAFGFAADRIESYFGVVTILQLPILLTSNAMYPSGTMPPWLQDVVSVNPISLAVNVMRANLFGAQGYAYPVSTYLAGLIGWAVLLIGVASVLAYRSFRTGVVTSRRSAWSPGP